MDEMIRYIFKSLRYSEKKTESMIRTIRKQQFFNSSVVIFATAVSAYAFLQDIEIRKNRKDIKNLKTKIKELKRGV